ncbi:amidohydrolase family protein [Mycolicibacterium sp. 018/SC-01/001]|uniref:amidohydrolase family protein n=1 Tax=Mycolicibacterium sp. 018/SC-01/001 TaxID=2592069 RepID=UPI00117F0888|nr:amidohydrolase family protein [Mycolicibacterium sp. 018/SC-01/001]TRW89127.1 amidohydrolase family protein [Mycolicibacterium sp. 018/SC-01/001]
MSAAGWDCHTHVFGPYDRYPLAPHRSYTPPEATVAGLEAHLDAIGLQRVVLVQPHSYGADTRAMMAALMTLGDRARGITVVDVASSTVGDLKRLRQQGIRGVRVNLHTAHSSVETTVLQRLVEMLAESGLHLQLFAPGFVLVELVPRLDAGIPVVVDHMGMVLHGNSPGEAAEVARVLCEHGCWIKLSAPERMGVEPGGVHVRHVVDTFASLAPRRIVWGSDWPHSALTHTGPVEQTEPFRQVDDSARLELLYAWLGRELHQSMLCENPEVLYS